MNQAMKDPSVTGVAPGDKTGASVIHFSIYFSSIGTGSDAYDHF